MTTKNETQIKKSNTMVSAMSWSDSAFNKRGCETCTTLTVDARLDRVEIIMQEFRIESGRESGSLIVLTRDEWNQFKKLILETGGEL